nr:MAG TPA: hypothetical protein [Bacteriophage sp.]
MEYRLISWTYTRMVKSRSCAISSRRHSARLMSRRQSLNQRKSWRTGWST